MKRYHVPRLAFINKMDRTGADPFRVSEEVREKLAADAIMMQIPIGMGEAFEGIVDLITMEAVYFDGTDGENIRREEIPAELKDEAETARGNMLESLAMYSDEMMELMLSEEDADQQGQAHPRAGQDERFARGAGGDDEERRASFRDEGGLRARRG